MKIRSHATRSDFFVFEKLRRYCWFLKSGRLIRSRAAEKSTDRQSESTRTVQCWWWCGAFWCGLCCGYVWLYVVHHCVVVSLAVGLNQLKWVYTCVQYSVCVWCVMCVCDHIKYVRMMLESGNGTHEKLNQII